MKLAQRGIALSLALVMGISPITSAERVVIPAGTALTLKLNNTIGSATHKKGDIVEMTVQNDVFFEGKKVISAGTPVQATVEDAAKRFFAGIGGYLKLGVQRVAAVDGTFVAIQFTKESKGETNIWSAILGVACCCVFLLIPGKNVTVEAGTLYNAVTLGPVEVSPKQVVNPQRIVTT